MRKLPNKNSRTYLNFATKNCTYISYLSLVFAKLCKVCSLGKSRSILHHEIFMQSSKIVLHKDCLVLDKTRLLSVREPIYQKNFFSCPQKKSESKANFVKKGQNRIFFLKTTTTGIEGHERDLTAEAVARPP